MAFKGGILVTGATGFLGSRTLERLIETYPGRSLIAAGRTIKPHAFHEHPQVEYRLGDLGERDYVQQLFAGPAITEVINCAALSSPWGQYEAFYRANVLSQQHLIEAAEQHQVRRFVFISTPSLYFDYRHRSLIKESDPLPAEKRMVNNYARTKRMAENLLEASQLSYIALRPRALVGRGDTVIMPRLIRAHEEGRLKVIGSGKNKVDLTPVSNVVDAILLSLIAPNSACREIYNIAQAEAVLLWPHIQQVLRELGYPPPTRKVPYPIVYFVAWLMESYSLLIDPTKEPTLTTYGVGTLAKDFHLDISKAQDKLGYQPRQSVAEAITEFVDWYRKQEK